MADLLFVNGRVLTIDADRPRAESVAVRDGKILAVGSNDELSGLRGSTTRIIDLDGATLMPGFIDAHTHFVSGSLTLGRVRLAGATTMAEMQRRVTEKVVAVLPGEWVVGRGWDDTKRTDVVALPTKEELDAIAPDNPVYLGRADGHVGWANSAALRLAGIDANRADPYGGRIVRDEHGEPTGILQETAKKLVEDILPQDDHAARTAAFRRGLAEAARYGITGIHDNAPAEDIVLFQDFRERGELTLRINTLVRGWEVPEPFLEPMIAIGARTGFGDDWIKLGALKLSLDGTLGSRTAAMLSPYSDDVDNTGVFRISQAELDPIVERAHRNHIQIALHAIGDAACKMALDAIERAIRMYDWPDHRHRIEHEQVITEYDMRRFSALGVIASLQPVHAITDLNWVESRVGTERMAGAYAWQSFLKLGTRICIGTDWPVETLDPRVGLYEAVTRRDLNGDPPEGRQPEEALTIEQTLKGYTLDAAWAEFAEAKKGSIEPGKYADLAILDADPTSIDPAELLSLRVLATLVEGRQVYSGDDRFELRG
ncbi:MAG TPA: amidohydrolase [Thermomicrobiales bacterium]|nr:amidohydrolase [Thermomicrobiales bacterium]